MTGPTLRSEWSRVEVPRYAREPGKRFSLFTSPRAGGWISIQGESTPLMIPTGGVPLGAFAFAVVQQLDQDDTLLGSLGQIIGRKLLEVDCVKAVYFDCDEEQTTISVWTILKAANDANRRKVYERELWIIDEFPSLLFNFRTTDTSGEEIPASSGYHYLTR